jgi:hypothetical protein
MRCHVLEDRRRTRGVLSFERLNRTGSLNEQERPFFDHRTTSSVDARRSADSGIRLPRRTVCEAVPAGAGQCVRELKGPDVVGHRDGPLLVDGGASCSSRTRRRLPNPRTRARRRCSGRTHPRRSRHRARASRRAEESPSRCRFAPGPTSRAGRAGHRGSLVDVPRRYLPNRWNEQDETAANCGGGSQGSPHGDDEDAAFQTPRVASIRSMTYGEPVFHCDPQGWIRTLRICHPSSG